MVSVRSYEVRVVRVDAELVPVRQVILVVFGNPPAQLPAVALLGVGPERHQVEGAEPHADDQVRARLPYGGHHFPQEAGPPFEVAAVRARTGVGPEKFVQE